MWDGIWDTVKEEYVSWPTIEKVMNEKKTRPPRNYAPTKLKAARLNAGLTQDQLAERTGINLGTLKHYEQGSRKFDCAGFDVIIKTCLALDCCIEDIIEDPEILKIYKEYKKSHS